MNQIYADYRWLIGPEGRRWLDRVAQDERRELALAVSLRRELSAERTHLVLEQRELRRRGRAKFAAADRMFFTPVALEQSTDQVVAAYKAGRFARGTPVLDLCCGIGGDLLAMAARGPAVGVDLEPIHALLARENASVQSSDHRVAVAVADVGRLAFSAEVAWHVDPDRRIEGRRTTRTELHSPDAGQIDAMLARSPDAAVKLAPAADMAETWRATAELEWIGRQGQCRQLVAWFGRLADEPGNRRATILDARRLDDEPTVYSMVGQAGRPATIARDVRRYVFEPDPAVLAAELAGELAKRHGLEALTGGGGYLTGDSPIDEPAMARFETLDRLPFDKRRVKRMLAARGIGRLEIKSRGVPIEPDVLRRELRNSGDTAGVLLLLRQGDSVTAIIAQRAKY